MYNPLDPSNNEKNSDLDHIRVCRNLIYDDCNESQCMAVSKLGIRCRKPITFNRLCNIHNIYAPDFVLNNDGFIVTNDFLNVQTKFNADFFEMSDAKLDYQDMKYIFTKIYLPFFKVKNINCIMYNKQIGIRDIINVTDEAQFFIIFYHDPGQTDISSNSIIFTNLVPFGYADFPQGFPGEIYFYHYKQAQNTNLLEAYYRQIIDSIDIVGLALAADLIGSDELYHKYFSIRAEQGKETYLYVDFYRPVLFFQEQLVFEHIFLVYLIFILINNRPLRYYLFSGTRILLVKENLINAIITKNIIYIKEFLEQEVYNDTPFNQPMYLEIQYDQDEQNNNNNQINLINQVINNQDVQVQDPYVNQVNQVNQDNNVLNDISNNDIENLLDLDIDDIETILNDIQNTNNNNNNNNTDFNLDDINISNFNFNNV